MTMKGSVSSVYESGLVTIIAGRGVEQRVFTTHKEVLIRVRYFASCLSVGFPEGQSNKIRLEADDPAAVACLVDFAYTGKIGLEIDKSVPGELHDLQRSHLMLFTQVYILADKYCWEECQNYVVDRLRVHHTDRVVCPLALTELDHARLGTSKLRRMLMGTMASDITDNGYKALCAVDKNLSPFIKTGGSAVEDLFEACVDDVVGGQELGNFAVDGSSCDWHVHITSRVCEVVRSAT